MCKFEVRVDRVLIHAPVGLVWDVLTGVERYDEWNPFTPQARTDFRIGSPAQLRVRMGPAKMKITETVCAFEKPRLIAWSKVFGTRWLLFAVREQHLEPMGDGRCAYHNTDRLTGVLAPLVWLSFGPYMRRGFSDVGTALKHHAESLYAQNHPGGTPG
ncbi:MAG: SRPBCC domain-containing protein [Gammaproteobacteria bacterium]|nr:SRPBCC domain-containing protein [Gammaproteobacteria bacterium]